MEGDRELGSIGCSGALTHAAGFALLLFFACCSLAFGDSNTQALYRAGQWNQAIAEARSQPAPSADDFYYAALSMAKLAQVTQAEQELEEGRKLFPRDKRFPTELAGLAYRRKNLSEAKRDLHQALKLDRTDQYATDFLATVYLLEQNLPAALKYWNRIDKPVIAALQFNPVPPLAPVLRARTFTISSGQIFTLQRLERAEVNAEMLGVFSKVRFDLLPRPHDGRFDLILQPNSEAPPLAGWIGRILPSLRDLPYQALNLDLYNIGHKALNFSSFGRWDPNKERVFLNVSAPYKENPRVHYSFWGDARNEIWNLRSSFHIDGLSLKRVEAGGAVTLGLSPKLQWTIGGDVAYRDFRYAPANPSFASGWTMLLKNKLTRDLIQWPERRADITGWTSLDAGRLVSADSSRLVTARAGLSGSWFPEPKGDRYVITEQLQAGRTFGNAPLDQLFMLAMERDTEGDLWFRGRVGTTAGRKGNAIMGREYGISQSDLKRKIFQIPFLRLNAGPFFDAAWTGDPSANFGSRGIETAAGGEAVLTTWGGIKLRVDYGRNLAGGGAFYTSVTR